MVTWHRKIYQGILIHELRAPGPDSWIHDTSTHYPYMYNFFKAPKCGISFIEVGPQT